jgi:glutathione S-transferase
LDADLADGRTYVCNDASSVADVAGMAALMICDFAKQSAPDELTCVKRWETAVRARPSWRF